MLPSMLSNATRCRSDSISGSAVCIDQSVFRILSQHNGCNAMQGYVSLCEPSLTHGKVVTTNPNMDIYGLT